MIRAALLSTCLLASPAMAECIDNEIVFLGDASVSMIGEPYKIQRAGHANAFRSAEVMERINQSGCGAIAVQYVEFATLPKVVIDWTIIETDEDAEAFAQAIESAPPVRGAGDLTDIAGAMEFAANSIMNNGIEATRRTVDVVSDGNATAGDAPSTVRDKYTQGPFWEQITFNGLPIARIGLDSLKIAEYFERQIIGGPWSFLAEPTTLENFTKAITDKFLREAV